MDFKELIVLSEQTIKDIVEKHLPEFAEICKNSESTDILIHQDAYAADFQIQEFLLLGMAIKYAGLVGGGKTVTIIGKNNETII